MGAGVIDVKYHRALCVVLLQHATNDFCVRREARITQLVLEKISTFVVEEVRELDGTSRGAASFWRTGVRSGPRGDNSSYFTGNCSDGGPVEKPTNEDSSTRFKNHDPIPVDFFTEIERKQQTLRFEQNYCFQGATYHLTLGS